MGFSLLIGIVAIGVVGFFIWANYSTKRQHARFRISDVRNALEEMISEEACCHDSFDLFLTWPIDDPYLESIRQRCIKLIEKDRPEKGRDISEQGAQEIRAILKELHERT